MELGGGHNFTLENSGQMVEDGATLLIDRPCEVVNPNYHVVHNTVVANAEECSMDSHYVAAVAALRGPGGPRPPEIWLPLPPVP